MASLSFAYFLTLCDSCFALLLTSGILKCTNSNYFRFNECKQCSTCHSHAVTWLLKQTLEINFSAHKKCQCVDSPDDGDFVFTSWRSTGEPVKGQASHKPSSRPPTSMLHACSGRTSWTALGAFSCCDFLGRRFSTVSPAVYIPFNTWNSSIEKALACTLLLNQLYVLWVYVY